MSYIQFDSYDNGTSGEDGPVTKDQLIDAICPDCGKAECECVTFQDGSTAHIDENGILQPYAQKGLPPTWQEITTVGVVVGFLFLLAVCVK